MKREFILIRTIGIGRHGEKHDYIGRTWHMTNKLGTGSSCQVGELGDSKIVKVVFTDKPPKPLCMKCHEHNARLLADMARYSRRPNRQDILSKHPDLETSPLTNRFYSEKTTIAKAKSK